MVFHLFVKVSKFVFVFQNRKSLVTDESLKIGPKRNHETFALPVLNHSSLLLPIVKNPFIFETTKKNLIDALNLIRSRTIQFGLNCSKIIFDNDLYEIRHALRFKEIVVENLTVENFGENCQGTIFSEYPQSKLEIENPLAFAISVFQNVDQFVRMFRVIVRRDDPIICISRRNYNYRQIFQDTI